MNDSWQPLTPDQVTDGMSLMVGGKGLNLARLRHCNVSVPSWYCIPAPCARGVIAAAGVADVELAPGSTSAAEVAEQMQQQIRGTRLPGEVRDAILNMHGRLFDSDTYVAVRSSAADEDGLGGSFAGMHDSFLFVRGEDQLILAVIEVWASAYNERALSYRLSRGLPLAGIAVAVIVQEMVQATVSGVVFTANPVTGSAGEVVVSAVYGAGEGLVSAGFDADTYTIRKSDWTTTVDLAHKTEQLVLDEAQGGGLIETAVADALQDARTLDAAQVRQLTDAARRIEDHYRRPQDIEFAWDADGQLYILQARPITTTVEKGPAAGQHLIWDNSNIVESYSDVTTPLTFSFIKRAYTIVYFCFSEVMGIRPSVVRANTVVFENMLGLIRGRVYYNLLNWYRLVRLFPGFNYNKGFMESMMGLKEPAELQQENPPASLRQRYFVELPSLLRLLFRMGGNFLRIKQLTADFQSHFKHRYDRWSAIDYRDLPPHEIMKIYRDMEDQLLWNWRAPIINDFYVMIFYGILKKLCQSWCGDKSGSLQNDLICGEGGIESTEPTKMLLRMAATVCRDETLKQLFLDQPPDVLAERIPADQRFTDFNSQLATYLERYGFRCMNELKLESFSLRDRPQFLYQVLRNYLATDDPKVLDIDRIAAREAKIRTDAEATAFATIPGWRRPLFRRVLRNARLGVKNRENMRFARTRIYGVVREMFRAVGEHFAAAGALASREDVFYLTVDEIWDFIKGTAVCTDLDGLATIRRREFDRYRSDTEALPDDRFETYGLVYLDNLFRNFEPVAEAGADGVLRGVGCCPGKVTGPVKVLRSPQDDLQLAGEILVAERTDPGWVPLYPSVSAVLIERGSILSHSAIVAREMGIPTIVGITGLCKALRSGQIVRMDGAAGTVEVVSEPTASETQT